MDAALLWLDTLLLGALRSGREVAVYGIVVRLLAIAPAAGLASASSSCSSTQVLS